MSKKTLFFLFVIFAGMQLLLPLSGIVKQEIILRDGDVYKFKTQPIDPYDPFRGKYVTIKIKNSVKLPREHGFEDGQKVYAVIATKEDGFSIIESISAKCPKSNNYFKTKIHSLYDNIARLKIPFDRYYIDERKVKKAEVYYQQHSRRGNHDAYIQVRVKNGAAALEELYVGDLPIIEFVMQEIKKQAEEEKNKSK
ncbi:GDYXXLXY domain-containing protein [bacterium]|nr:GDYXXLXY domain-containing protein [bacterium]